MPQEAGLEEIESFMRGGTRLSRRRFLRLATAAPIAAAASGAMLRMAHAQEVPDDPNKVPGLPSTNLSRGRSPFERTQRTANLPGYFGIPQTSSTDQRNFVGTLTPSDMHFERHHNGVSEIDPSRYRLLIHGMVERPMIFTLSDLKRLPQISHMHFVECSGDSSGHWTGVAQTATILNTLSIYSSSEWAGVPLQTLFRAVGAKPEARWFLAESYDGAAMTRSVPMSKGWDDGYVAYGQNGEAVRPEQGYPARLLLPGWEGNINVKWLRRIEVSDQPFFTREETSKYTDPIPFAGQARWFTMEWDAKSIITHPSPGLNVSGPGLVELRGLAWSGRGKIAQVEVSADGGSTWDFATMEEPILPKAATRFRYPWVWSGQEATILSRATDETGYVQPTRNDLLSARGQSQYHFNGIQAWKVNSDGTLVHAYHESPMAALDAVPLALAGPWPLEPDCGLA